MMVEGSQQQTLDLDFVLLGTCQLGVPIKKTSVAAVSALVGFHIHKEKNKILKYITENTNSITLHNETLEEIERFTYLGRIIDEQGGFDVDDLFKDEEAIVENDWEWVEEALTSTYQEVLG
ncbi:unnamed protein product [Schistosoma margrebowiei]|uniref:Uncharacterized protein n=1 Tax=Schistosoma margrebowiei TaxID=48269 RepID=A0A183LWE9_9TREM|nr:unnamed protein product [Schistosoma margrebowiei]